MITSIRWDKMFGPDAGKGVELEYILPLGGHLYVVGTTWAMVNPPWVRAFPYTEFREGVTGGLVLPDGHRPKESAQEYHRQRVSGEPVERVEDESKRSNDHYRVRRRRVSGYRDAGPDAVIPQKL